MAERNHLKLEIKITRSLPPLHYDVQNLANRENYSRNKIMDVYVQFPSCNIMLPKPYKDDHINHKISMIVASSLMGTLMT